MFKGNYISKRHNVAIRATVIQPGADLSGFGLNRQTQDLLQSLPGKNWVGSVEGENTTLIVPDSVFMAEFAAADAAALAE